MYCNRTPPPSFLLFVTLVLVLIVVVVNGQGECAECACSASSYNRVGVCSYCNSPNAQQLTQYGRTCQNFPDYVQGQLKPMECTAGPGQYLSDNACCPQFETGDQVLVLGFYHDQGSFRSPIESMPWQCDATATADASMTLCDANAASRADGVYQKCTPSGWCGLPVATVVASANQQPLINAATLEESTTVNCYYQVEFDSLCYPNFTQTTKYYPQHWLIPVIDELVEPCAADGGDDNTTTDTTTDNTEDEDTTTQDGNDETEDDQGNGAVNSVNAGDESSAFSAQSSLWTLLAGAIAVALYHQL